MRAKLPRVLFWGTLGFWAGCILMGFLWRFTPLYSRWSPAVITLWVRGFEGHSWMWLAILAAYIVGGLLLFLHAVLLWTTVFIFDPWHAVLYCELGTLASGLTLYGLGRIIRPGLAARIAGSTAEQASRDLGRHAKKSLILLHWFPVCPFSVVNFIAGGTHVSLVDFVTGTLIGCTPGILLICFFGNEILNLLQRKHWLEALPVAIAALGLWIGTRLFRKRLASG